LIALTFQLRGEIHRRGENVGDAHRLGQQPAGDDSAARNQHHGIKLAFKLRHQFVNETVNIVPGKKNTAGRGIGGHE